ncbi:hypothetical protein HNY73_007708 [Argiope bruennichi]|uniref:ATP-dependent DNA helicase n=1 Tax=Argiope bruennichi TaxID=94029 RepID=A0A8T0FHV0_ARGBR|nr:hypothetical protein HNY73_007708 [Argiope bruennichi]
MAFFGIQTTDINDEIASYQVGRYVNCNEAIWRIFSFPIHELCTFGGASGEWQRVYFTVSNVAQRAEVPPPTILMSFFVTCQSVPFTRTLLYSEMPRYYTWNASSKKFQRRKQGDAVPGHPDVRSTDALGRIYTLPPKNVEYFYLRLLVKLRMPAPDREINDAFNRELELEREYDRHKLAQSVQTNVPLLYPQQKEVYDTLMNAIDDVNGGLFFLVAPGGTGKTFLISLLLATVRARSEIAVAVASSGIMATLLEGCRTSHSSVKVAVKPKEF